MIRKNLKLLAVTSVVMLLPILSGVILWNKLPGELATHWGFNGEINGYSSKAFCVFGLPFIMLALQWICIIITSRDPKNAYQHESVWKMVIWIFPIISIYMHFMIYSAALGKEFNSALPVCLFMGVLLLYLSRLIRSCRPNHSIGIRIKPTLTNKNNWYSTHRFASKLWLACGILLILCVLLPIRIIVFLMIPIILAAIVIPIVYSFVYTKKK